MPAVLSEHEDFSHQQEEEASALSESVQEDDIEEWVQYIGKSTGEPYWQHKVSRKIVWKSPHSHSKGHSGNDHDDHHSHDGQDEQHYDHDDHHGHEHLAEDQEVESEETKELPRDNRPRRSMYNDPESLPSNWKRLMDKSSGTPYYLFLPTKKTQWEPPSIFEKA